MSALPTWHPSADDLGRCLRGELPEGAAAGVIAHVDSCPDCQASLETLSRPAPPPLGPPPEVPGFTLLGEDPIGEGGMGEVFRAVETDIGREVAIKIVHRCHAAAAQRPRLVKRFVEEVRLLGRIQHAGVPPVYRFGYLGPGRDQPFVAMRLIPWPTLADELAADWAPGKGGPAPDRLNVYLIWFSRVCEAVGYAHDHGAVHLDLKPANIKVHRSGEVQVLDWGLGRGFMATPDGKTQLISGSAVDLDVGPVGHTAEYSPPEQVRGGHRDPKMHPRADVFALGSILCEVLTGRPAFTGSSPEERFNKAWSGDLADARARLDRAAARHPELAALALWCLAADPADRPPDAGAVAAEVRRIILSAENRLRSARTRFKVAAAMAGAVVLALAGGLVALDAQLTRFRDQERAEAKDREEKNRKRAEVRDRVEVHLKAAEQAAADAGRGDFEHPDDRADRAADWNRAVAAARQADREIDGKEVDPDLVRRVAEVNRHVGEETDRFARDKALLDALDVARARKVYSPDPDTDAAFSGAYLFSRSGAGLFEAAFRAAGLDTAREPGRAEAFTAYFRDHPRAAGTAAAALDQWYLLDRSPKQEWLLDLADRIDPNGQRKEVRAAVRHGRAAARVRARAADKPQLNPEAALLLAGGLEPESKSDMRPDREALRAVEEAARVLREAAPGGRGARYWVHLSCGFYLWHSAGGSNGWGPVTEAIDHLQTAEKLIADRGPVAAGDQSAAGVLRAAAGGLRVHVVARRSGPAEVRKVLDDWLMYYPGYWPNYQLAVHVQLDRGDAAEAARLAAKWREHHGKSFLAQGYAEFALGLTDSERQTRKNLRELSDKADGLKSFLDGDRLRELRRLLHPDVESDRAGRAADPVVEPDRPGRAAGPLADRTSQPMDAPDRTDQGVKGLLAARLRADHAYARLLARDAVPGQPPPDVTDFRPWRLAGPVPPDSEVPPRVAVEAAPWSVGAGLDRVRELLASGDPAEAANAAERLAPAHTRGGWRVGLFHLYRARLHVAAAEWTDDEKKAQAHRDLAHLALAAVREQVPLLAHHANALEDQAARVERVERVLAKAASAHGACGRVAEAEREYGVWWRTAWLAGRAFQDAELARSPFTAPGMTGREPAVARAAVLAAWGYGDIPPSREINPKTRVTLLDRVRAWVEKADAATRAEFLADPIVRSFLADIRRPVGVRGGGEQTPEDKDLWLRVRADWIRLADAQPGRLNR